MSTAMSTATDGESKVNIPLLRKAVEWAEAEAAKPPELCEWEQRRYIVPNPSDRALYLDSGPASTLEFDRSPDCGTCFCIAGKVAFDVAGNMSYDRADEIATKALGLDSDQSNELFDGDNTIEDVRRIAEEIAGERL